MDNLTNMSKVLGSSLTMKEEGRKGRRGQLEGTGILRSVQQCYVKRVRQMAD